MTTSRRSILEANSGAAFHCTSRCVRRAFLCGFDQLTGQSYLHRRAWIEARLHHLAACFAVSVHAYAIMSNHFHVVLRLQPNVLKTWDDAEVARRWVRIFPSRARTEAADRAKADGLLRDPGRVAVVRARLVDLSWFMRCLNEHIARRANREDDCTGRFWEGRFKCQVLLDDRATLAAMVYVDLNPIRAGISDSIEASEFTSGRRRWLIAAQDRGLGMLAPIAGLNDVAPYGTSTIDYLALLEWSARAVAEHRMGVLAGTLPKLLSTYDISVRFWSEQVNALEKRWWRAIGANPLLRSLAERLGQHWLKGCRRGV